MSYKSDKSALKRLNAYNMKQTAVEWLYERFLFAGYAVPAEWKEQAKEMEKEHLMMAYNDGYVNAVFKGTRKPIEYYKETYEKDA